MPIQMLKGKSGVLLQNNYSHTCYTTMPVFGKYRIFVVTIPLTECYLDVLLGLKHEKLAVNESNVVYFNKEVKIT